MTTPRRTTETLLARPHRRRLSFTTETLLLEVGVVLLIVVIGGSLFLWSTIERSWEDAERQALGLARTVASEPALRTQVAAISAQQGTPPVAQLRAGPIFATAEAARTRTGALFVVVTDETGVRLAHPTADRLGQVVSTDPSAALRGEEVTTRNTGTLGASAGAKVPVYAPGSAAVVGEVSVGFSRESVTAVIGRDAVGIVLGAFGALVVGLLASLLLRRRLARKTLGLQPEQLRELVQDQVAVLEGVDEGVVGVAPDGHVTVGNDAALELLGLPHDVAGRPWASLPLPAGLLRLDTGGASPAVTGEDPAIVVHEERVLLVTVRAVQHGGRDLGRVVLLRDHTDLQQLTRRLDAVETMSGALRAQRHEFSNQLHTLAGYLGGGDVDGARAYLAELAGSGPLVFPAEQIDLLGDAHLQAFIGAKSVQAAERGVALRVGPETLVRGTVASTHEVTTVLGNLIDNAIKAAVAGASTDRWVEVEALDDATTLHLVVADSGDGIPEAARGAAQDIFAEGYSTDVASSHPHSADPSGPSDAGRGSSSGLGLGSGLGLALSRRLGGDTWVASPGRPGGPGAVMCARLPTVMAAGVVGGASGGGASGGGASGGGPSVADPSGLDPATLDPATERSPR
ncbi:ATP-binding protein [Tersicoccus sp. Bi-70]|uniref:sensor histidine kinase n=1 Tax=Tersicoccus sp. Bi-70 TaxID=1897634 RepID=UPI0009789727|nr:ATP-binding protein [Tersicoccus sp. Bi-70]OMH31293.1 hypothetical protein BGP79_09705 [Tersicoccus sp. Bi-70]